MRGVSGGKSWNIGKDLHRKPEAFMKLQLRGMLPSFDNEERVGLEV